MDLPFRIQDEGGRDAVLSVDGSFGAPGLELSHWPGNRTPPELKHDLSTGIALNFARLAPARRRELTDGLVAIANNHVDTDGVLALFALVRPNEALPRADALLAAAEAGDRFRVPTEAAFVVDQILTGLFDEARSPWRDEWRGLDARERHRRASLAIVEELPAILDGDVEPWAALWREPLARLAADRARLAAGVRDELVHLSSTIWLLEEPGSAPDRPAGSPDASPPLDPGRHALFGATRADRVCVLGRGPRGTTCRLIVGTGSFFELVDERVPRRPRLDALRDRLNELEGRRPPTGSAAEDADAPRWRCDAEPHASPELWFGRAKPDAFPEHAGAWLAPSSLDALAIKSAVLEALREPVVLSDEEAEDEGDWMDV